MGRPPQRPHPELQRVEALLKIVRAGVECGQHGGHAVALGVEGVAGVHSELSYLTKLLEHTGGREGRRCTF